MQERVARARELIMTRQLIGKPSQEEVGLIMQVLPGITLNAGKDFLDSSGLDALSKYKLIREQKTGDISRTALCANFLLVHIGLPISETARKAFEEKDDIELFRFLFDFAAGMKAVAGIAISAEEEIAGREDEIRMKFTLNDHPSVGEGANQYLNMVNEDRKSAELLKKDPTGALLIDDLIDRIENETSPRISPFQPKEYFLAGVRMAKDLYTRLYSTAAPLYPDKEP